jgi:small subunit ribosomal protein S18
MNCYFCKNKIEVDWKDVDLLKKFISAGMKIKHRKYTKFCAKHQRKYAQAVKRARVMKLLPYFPGQW